MKIKKVIKRKSFLAMIEPGLTSSQEITLATAPLKWTIRILHEERLSSPNLNTKGPAHVTTYWFEPLFKTFNSPSSRVVPSIISKAVHLHGLFHTKLEILFTYNLSVRHTSTLVIRSDLSQDYVQLCSKRMGRIVVVINLSFYESFTRVNSMRSKAMQSRVVLLLLILR